MIPVSLVTGFLGSGKTTLVSALLRQPGMAGTLVIVNEFGEAGIDHDLLEASSDDTILLANGCLCCTIRGNLVDTLLDLRAQRAEGRLRDFDRVVVETSGVADPGPLIGFVFDDPRIAALYRPGAVVTTCDALAGADVLDRQSEALSQAVLADHLLVTKPDLAGEAAVAALVARLRALNPAATIRAAALGQGVEAALLDAPDGARRGACAPGCADPHHHHDHPGQDHAARFHAWLLLAARALSFAEVEALGVALRGAAAAGLLRAKGLLPLADRPGCAVVQATATMVHPPAILPDPPSGPGRLVLIGEGPEPRALLDALAPFGLAPVPRLPMPHAPR
ncbi:CobW family GTP-binding protein [Falsiroseomonas sp. CW058]|uniref:CobW family GTP-binding protein n=1 Tax=Falsiroseomonas sp. CW058 TaxID=3388664 RepID=UPI003D31BC09